MNRPVRDVREDLGIGKLFFNIFLQVGSYINNNLFKLFSPCYNLVGQRGQHFCNILKQMLLLGMQKVIYYLNLFTQSEYNLDNFELKEVL